MNPAQTLAVAASAIGLVMTGDLRRPHRTSRWRLRAWDCCSCSVNGHRQHRPTPGSATVRQRYLGIAARIFFVVGLLGILSIGLPFLIAGILGLAAFTRFEGQA